ncbi:DUF6286 domain-containing protein [Actinomadura atramentaria]|uniref:DUF6286 domain-containing protein n=1 Tax=Actinomadura atramentaria TaxID=1990 RepID=UPI00036F5839|nr:DUF6286 domain-containing protein [Actinomadura atramentaria]
MGRGTDDTRDERALIIELLDDLAGRQRARRFARREFRARRAWLSLALALLLALGAGTVAVEIVARVAGRPAGLLPVADAVALLRTARWGDRGVGAAGVALAAAGAALLGLSAPGRWRLLPVRCGDGRLAGGVRRRDVRRVLTGAALGVHGVERARVRVRGGAARRRVRVRARTGYLNVANTPELIDAAVRARLAGLDLMGDAAVDVRVTCRNG